MLKRVLTVAVPFLISTPRAVRTPAIPHHLLIDCDPGIDDALALSYAYAHPQVAIEGIVATGGNVSTEQVGRNVRGLLELLGGQGTPWALGAENPLAQPLTTTEETHGPSGTGYGALPRQSWPSATPSATLSYPQAPGRNTPWIYSPPNNTFLP